MKVLGVEGSPRNNGNTEKLVKAILEGAAGKGSETVFYKLADMDISVCRGCSACRQKGECVIDDDMTLLRAEIQSSDLIILGSPVFMWQVSGLTKLFMDRLVPFIRPDFSTRLQGEKGVLFAFTQGNPDKDAFALYFDYLQRLFAFLHFNVKGAIVAAGTRLPDDIEKQQELLGKALRIGESLVR